jgi:hypothetical protein
MEQLAVFAVNQGPGIDFSPMVNSLSARAIDLA